MLMYEMRTDRAELAHVWFPGLHLVGLDGKSAASPEHATLAPGLRRLSFKWQERQGDHSSTSYATGYFDIEVTLGAGNVYQVVLENPRGPDRAVHVRQLPAGFTTRLFTDKEAMARAKQLGTEVPFTDLSAKPR